MTVSLDIGLKRIGVALSPDDRIAIPQNPIIRRGRRQAADDVRRFLAEWGADTLVVGIPRGGSAEEEMERRIRHFVSLLELPDSVNIYYQNEAFSSVEAEEGMRGIVKQGSRDGKMDSIAAKIILERWFEKRNGHEP